MSKAIALCWGVASAMIVFAAAPASAQSTTSRAVVQPLPSEETQRLNRALVQLAKRPRSIPALIEAGDAASDVNDLDAALGFYTRAREIAPENAKVSLGLGRVYLQSGRPLSALPYFTFARESGAKIKDYLLDEALALDMVGDQAAAQSAYARVLESNPKANEARRRLALSYAISGNSAAFESTLRPLIERRDFAAFRTRAFGLAIMGEQERAAAIVDAVMPRDLAGQINPYLDFMPRLTPAQQAAAANLGIFPKPADIGRDSEQIAAYQAGDTEEKAPAKAPVQASVVDKPDRLLEPSGAPLGDTELAVNESESGSEIAEVATDTSQPQKEAVAEAPQEPKPVLVASAAPDKRPAAVDSEPTPEPTPKPEPAVQTPAEPTNVADAFADLLAPTSEKANQASSVSTGAVDIAKLDVQRDLAKKPEPKTPPKPKKPAHPKRIWVQVATGRDLKALGFDWRRLSRKAPDLLGDFDPHTVPWGQANRLLAGPIETRKAARDLVNALKEKGIETFSYSSPEGTEIQKLKR